MDAFCDPTVEQVVVMSSAQVGKTEILNNVLGYYIDLDPCPILVVHPTVGLAEDWSKERLNPMLRDSPCFKDKVPAPRSRDGNNTILKKDFTGGNLAMAGANVPTGLAAKPRRVVLFDEVDRFPLSAGKEGDPIRLGIKRAATFWNRKLGMFSTPTLKDLSRIAKLYEESSRGKFYVPCEHCGHKEHLTWQNVKWNNSDPSTAVMMCSECGAARDDAERWRAVSQGEWVHERPKHRVRGFHLNELYSPWRRLEEVVTDFYEAKDDPEQLRAWTNTSLGEVWEEQGEEIDAHDLAKRREDYATIPEGGLLLTAGVDVQKSHLEAEVVAWGIGEESWGIEHKIFEGDPEQEEVWQRLDDWLQIVRKREDGAMLHVSMTCVDSGYCTQSVYRFCRARWKRGVVAIKGFAGEGRPLIGRAGRNNKMRCRVFPLGVDGLKHRILMSHLQQESPGPGFAHFPAEYDGEYFEQLTAEKLVQKRDKGQIRRVWVKTRKRNEALDLRVYAFAALLIIDPDLHRLAQRIKETVSGEDGDDGGGDAGGEAPKRSNKRQSVRRPSRKRGGYIRTGRL